MQCYPTYPAVRPRSQAIPMSAYRRQLVIAQWRPRVLFLLFVVSMYKVASSPLVSSGHVDYPFPLNAAGDFAVRLSAVPASTELRPSLAEALVTEAGEAPSSRVVAALPAAPVGSSSVQVKGAGNAAATNAAIAISFVNGYVIQPGASFSFDDVARTWDFREDPRYVFGPATSARGAIMMRGGGVCWLSTALWRATLLAGLSTDVRVNHYGLVDALGSGLDATNTLVVRNDSDLPITIHAWMDQDDVHVQLYAEGDLGRTGVVRGPQREGPGRWVAYQDINWADGQTTTRTFTSTYHW